MKDFDSEQQDRLQFLTRMRAFLHFPFFANTFSLPYHYANALRRADDPKEWEAAKACLKEHNWEDPTPTLQIGHQNVFYATRAAFELLEKSEEGKPWDLVGVPFTKYQPLWVFTDFRAFLPHPKFKGGKPEELSKGLMERIRQQSILDIELLTDIPHQANKLRNHLDEWGFSHKVYTIEEPVDALKSIKAKDRVLRLYFYGAPTTSRMMGDLVHYIPFTIPVGPHWEDKTTITQICLAIPKDWRTIEERDEQKLLFSEIMAQYHARVFQVASVDYTALLNVWWAYNRYAERKQHSSTFKTPKAFAECLIEHHASLP